MAISLTEYYQLTLCCDPTYIINLYWEDSQPQVNPGVYTYKGESTQDLIFDQCYFVDIIQGTPSEGLNTFDPAAFEAQISQNCEDAIESGECGCLNSYKVINCVDQELGFDFVPSEGSGINIGDVISLNLNAGDVISIGNDDLCISSFRIVHPDINGGVAQSFNGTAIKQLNLWNGKNYYKITLTETDHGVIGLELNYYFVWSGVRWEVWNNFDLGLGPSNLECEQNLPLAALTGGIECINEEPISTATCDYCVATECIGYNSQLCDSYIVSIRTVEFCAQDIIIQDFINCWQVIANIVTTPQHPTLSITENFIDCEECLTEKNQPPCIKATDCATGTVLYLTSTIVLENYIGKVIKVEIGTLEKCYLIEVSDICPEEPTTLPGIIVDCFSKCEDCVPKCVCTRVRNNSTEPRRLVYIDCNNQEQETSEVVGVGKLSKKYCVYRWISEEVEVIEFGNCVDNECPEVPRPQKFVTPGYDTPICTPAHYERIVCKYSDGWYKKMLEERYGIADCCPNDHFQNNIKYELIHLQMLNDPDYECTPVRQGCAPHCSAISLTITRECPPEPPVEETEENEEIEEELEEVIDPENTDAVSAIKQVDPD
jgi:hypothetical protein